nr:hypothetical protein [Brevibacterium atlanticum]
MTVAADSLERRVDIAGQYGATQLAVPGNVFARTLDGVEAAEIQRHAKLDLHGDLSIASDYPSVAAESDQLSVEGVTGLDAAELIVTVLELISELLERRVQLCRVHRGNVVGETVKVSDGHLLQALAEGEDFEDVILTEAGDSDAGTRTSDYESGAFKDPQALTDRRPGDSEATAEMFLDHAIVRPYFPAEYQFTDLDRRELRQAWTVDERVSRL